MVLVVGYIPRFIPLLSLARDLVLVSVSGMILSLARMDLGMILSLALMDMDYMGDTDYMAGMDYMAATADLAYTVATGTAVSAAITVDTGMATMVMADMVLITMHHDMPVEGSGPTGMV